MLTAIKAVFAHGYCDEPRLVSDDPKEGWLICSLCGAQGTVGDKFTHHNSCPVGLVYGVMQAVVWSERQ